MDDFSDLADNIANAAGVQSKSSSGGVVISGLPKSAANFPVVTPEQQNKRDQGRLQILNQELSTEKNPQNQASLNREISSTQQGIQSRSAPLYNPNEFNADDIISALNGGGSYHDALQQAQPQAHQQSQGGQQLDRIKSLATQSNQAIQSGKESPDVGIGEALGNIVSGMGSSVYGGYKGLYDLASGQGLDRASQDIQQAQQQYTYQPKTATGKLITDIASVPLNAAKEGFTSVGGDIGQYLNGDQGRIAGESIGNALPDVAATLGMGSGMLGKSSLAEIRPTELSKIEPTLSGVTKEPISNAQIQISPQSVGAAATKYSDVAASRGAPSELINELKKIEVSGQQVDPVAANRKITASTLDTPISLTEGQATGDIQKLSEEMNMRGNHPELANTFNAQNNNLIQNFDDIRQRVAPDIAARGTDLDQMAVDAYKNMDAPIKADISAKYQALADANGGSLPMKGSDFVSSADAALKSDNVTRFLPPEVGGILSDMRDGGEMSYNDFENYRTILAQQARKADRAGDGTASHAINVVRNSLESMPMTEEGAAIKPLADAARSAAKARFDAIASDPAYKAAINDGVASGEPSNVADDFIKKYAINGKMANLKNMVENLSSDPLNKQILSAGLIDHLKSQSNIDLRTNTGNVSQSGLNKTINRLGDKSSLILGAEDAGKVNDLGDVARWTQEQPKGSYVNNSNTFVSSIAKGVKDIGLGALNIKTLGASNFLLNKIADTSKSSAVTKSLSQGAGLTKIKDLAP